MNDDRLREVLSSQPAPRLSPFFSARVVAAVRARRRRPAPILWIVVSGIAFALVSPLWSEAITASLIVLTPLAFGLAAWAPRLVVGAASNRRM